MGTGVLRAKAGSPKGALKAVDLKSSWLIGFQGIMSLARIIRWDVDPAFDRALSPEEIMDELEKRVGPEGRKLFERFLRQVNKLQMQQQLEAQAQTVRR